MLILILDFFFPQLISVSFKGQLRLVRNFLIVNGLNMKYKE